MENPATKAAGFFLLFLSVPALLSLGLGRLQMRGDETDAGGVVGRAVAETVRSRLGTTGAVLLAAALLLIAIPLSTQLSLADIFSGIRTRFAGIWSRATVAWVRRRDKRTKERLKRRVVAKHIEKARREPVTLSEVPFVSEEALPTVREIPGPGGFSIRKTTAAAAAAPAAPYSEPASKPARKEPQPKLPLVGIDGYPYPEVSLLDRHEARGIVDRKILAETGKTIEAKCREFGVDGDIIEYHPGPVVTTYEFRPSAGIKVNQVMNLSEDLAFRQIIRLARHTEVGVYFVHTTAKEGVAAIAEARQRSQPVYGEALHNYLQFTCEDYKKPGGTAIHTYPALKYPEDRDALIAGLLDGELCTTATDDFTVHKDVKLWGNTIHTVCGGHNGIETRLPVAFTKFVVERHMSLPRFAAITSTNAARILGLYPQKGAIMPGSDADLVLIDPTVTKTLTLADLHSDADYSIWEGFTCRGYPVMTILRGKVIVENGKLVGRPSDGRWVKRKIGADVLARPAV